MKYNDFLVVVGPVGSGKTTLLYSIMEETQRSEGTALINGKVAYVEQEPFIFSGSIRDNITFGLPFDEAKFKAVITACQLTKDLELFARREATVIGERGINISGGQKARISLARAVYSDADIFLFDDPLSAVDPEVANKIFTDCF